jgi:hypothetical protein
MSECAESEWMRKAARKVSCRIEREKGKAQCKKKVKGRSKLPPAKKLSVSPVTLVFEMKLGAGACG